MLHWTEGTYYVKKQKILKHEATLPLSIKIKQLTEHKYFFMVCIDKYDCWTSDKQHVL